MFESAKLVDGLLEDEGIVLCYPVWAAQQCEYTYILGALAKIH